MPQPTAFYELVYKSDGTVDSTRTTHLASATSVWCSRTLPISGKATLDSTVEGNNCECIQYLFSGHGAGNYVTNFRYYVGGRSAVASDFTHLYRTSTTFTNPATYTDADIYNMTGDWTTTPISVPVASNVTTDSSYTATSDPTRTAYIYNAVVVEAGKTTGTGTWSHYLLYQYT